MNTIFESTKIAVGILMLFLGSFGFVFGVVAMLDPVSGEIPGDSAPFGFTMNFVESFSAAAFYLGVFVSGIGILSGKDNIGKFLGGKLQ